MAAERWPLPSDLQMEIDLHNEPGLVSWVVDYFKRGRNPPEIVLRVKGAEVVGKETKAKEVGVVCFTRPNDAGLEIWFEVLKNKQIKRTILPMATCSDKFVFKKHSDKKFDFVDYMERKGLKITLPSTETNPSQSGAAGTSTSGEGSKKLKGKSLVKKLNVVTPKKATTGTVEAPKKATTGTAEAPKKSTGTVQAPKLKMSPTGESNPKKGTHGVTPELQASKLISETSADTTGQKTKTVKFIHPTNPQSILPSKVGSSSRHTSSTANAPGPDNTRTSPEQSVQPPTVNPNGHSGDGGSVVDSGKKNLQVVEYNDESSDEDPSSKTKKR
ncbi:hypothetical protein R1sor_022509 [Riccia sorocarpa]|uniref:Uncharacterized protein n=1 Tax=Riccia sorocarpa TaxID=122646 RepID=A0ABD3GKR9_9MARC